MKRLIILAIVLVSTLMLCGAASAASVTTVNTTVASQGSSDNCLTVGEAIAKQAKSDSKLALNQSKGSLLITNAGSHKINNHTTEGALESIVNQTSTLSKAQKISYGKANILTLTNNDPLEFVFTTKLSSGKLMAKRFLVTWKGTSYMVQAFPTINIGLDMTSQEWSTAQTTFGKNAYNTISIANAWNSGAPADLLAQVETTGRVAPGTVSGYVMTKGVLNTYWPDTLHEYIIVTNAGGYDDDAPVYLMTWNYKYYSMNGANPLESAYIYWKKSTGSGTLVLMKFNDSLKTQFKNEKGITVTSDTLSEIKFTSWLIYLLKTNPAKVITVEKTANINQTNLNYIYGSSTQIGKGLSTTGRNYIMSLSSTSAFRILPNAPILPNTDSNGSLKEEANKNGYADVDLYFYDKFVAKGEQMAEYAKNILDTIPGRTGPIAFETGPAYVTSFNRLIGGVYDGITSVIKTYDPNDIMGIRNGQTYDSFQSAALVVVFMQRAGVDENGSPIVTMLQARYDPNQDKISYSVPIQVINDKLYPNRYENGSFNYTSTGGVMGFNIMPAWWRTAQIWGGNATYDYLDRFVKTSCCCWSPGIEITDDYITSYLPLREGEQYILIGIPFDTGSTYGASKIIQGRLDDLITSPGAATFFTPGELYNLTVGIVIRWNSETQTGVATLIKIDHDVVELYGVSDSCLHAVLFGTLGKLQDYENPPYNTSALIVFYEAILNGKTNATVDDLNALFTISKEILISKSDLAALTAAGSDPVSYMENYVQNVVSVNPGDDLQIIINNAAVGSWIYINDNNGTSYTYDVNLVINKRINLVGNGSVTIRGVNASIPVISLGVGADGTTITGLNITGATVYYGIVLNGTNGITITNSTIYGNLVALKFISSTSNTIVNNNITSLDTTPPTVTVDVKAGTYNTSKTVKLTKNDPNSIIYYTTDGTTPTTSSTVYTGPITISSTKTLKFIGVDEAGNVSPVYSQLYTIDKVKPTASANVKSGTYKSTQKVYLKMNESGSIYYTINGSTPTNKSKKYTGAISVSKTTTTRFLAIDKAGNKSSVYTAKYTIDKVRPKVSSASPKNGATNVKRSSTLTIKFSENIKNSTNWSKIYVKDVKTGKKISITKSIKGKVLTIKTSKKAAKSQYQIYIPASAIKDVAGNTLAKTYAYKIRTGKT